jgi:hypothetical protein
LQVAWSETVPEFFSHAMQLEDSRDVVIDGFEGRQAQDSGSAIFLDRVERISVRNSVAAHGTDAFLSAQELGDVRLFFGNDLGDAKTRQCNRSIGKYDDAKKADTYGEPWQSDPKPQIRLGQ